MILLPWLHKGKLVNSLLEEQDTTGGACNQSFFIDQIHLPQIFVMHLLECVQNFTFVQFRINFLNWRIEHLTLSVKGKDFIFWFAVKAFPWKVLVVTVHFHGLVTGNLFAYMIVDETVMGCCECMIKIGVYQLICNKSAGDERIWEVIDWHHIVIQI